MRITKTQILRFLIEVNKRLDGIYICESTEYDHPRPSLTFNCNLTNLFISANWEPSSLFFRVIDDAAQANLKITKDDFSWNNNKTTFWYQDRMTFSELDIEEEIMKPIDEPDDEIDKFAKSYANEFREYVDLLEMKEYKEKLSKALDLDKFGDVQNHCCRLTKIKKNTGV